MRPRAEARPLVVAAALASLCVGSAFALAAPRDPSLPQRVTVGPPDGSCPCAGCSPARSHRSPHALPTRGTVTWQARIPGGTDHAPVVDADGRLVAASSTDRLVQLEPGGKVDWSTDTGAGALTGPTLTSSRTRVVLLDDGNLLGVDEAGAVRFRTATGLPSTGSVPDLVPSASGEVVAARGSTAVLCGSDGSVRARAELDEPVAGMLYDDGWVRLIGQRGTVYGWRPPEPPRELGRFGARVSGAVSGAPGAVFAIVDERRVVRLEARSGRSKQLLQVTKSKLEGDVAVAADGSVRVMSDDGTLLAFGANGKELFRASLRARSPVPAQFPGGSRSNRHAPALVDGAGRAAVAPPGTELALIAKDGSVERVPGTSCFEPRALLPGAKGGVIVVCESGVVRHVGAAK